MKCRAAILAAGSAGILARRRLGRQAGSLPYVGSQCGSRDQRRCP